MANKLRALVVEDSADDAELIDHQLRDFGFDTHVLRVETEGSFREALGSASWDVVISDFSLPRFSAPAALAVLRDTGKDIPFILVSGSVGEDIAVRMMKAGAQDYILKQNLARLAASVERELREAENRRRRREAEEEQQALQGRLIGILDNAAEAIISLDDEERIILFNRAAEHIFGYSSDEALGRTLDCLLPETTAEIRRSWMLDFPADLGVSPAAERTIKARGRRKSGKEFPVRASMSRWMYKGRAVSTVILQDESEHQQLMDQLLHSQRMEVMGQLAGGIAHDFNNLLTVISGYANLLLSESALDEPNRRCVEEVERAAARAAALTARLLAFSRKQNLRPRAVDLNALLAEMQSMLRRLLGEHIRVHTDLTPSLPAIFVDPNQFEQVVLNLAVNARDAMPLGGEISIRTRHGHQPCPLPSLKDCVVLEFADTGQGMDNATMARIFEPFFTTKEVGKGTGLGLSTVHGIVQQSDGHVEVSSEVGKGTTFRIHLPARNVVVSAPSIQHQSVQKGSGTILVVEDEDALRSLITSALARTGYTVLDTPNPTAALEVYRRAATPPDLLLTDVVMPGMSGPDLAHRLERAVPRLKVLYMSTMPERNVRLLHTAEAGIAFLKKPFTVASLLKSVQEAMA